MKRTLLAVLVVASLAIPGAAVSDPLGPTTDPGATAAKKKKKCGKGKKRAKKGPKKGKCVKKKKKKQNQNQNLVPQNNGDLFLGSGAEEVKLQRRGNFIDVLAFPIPPSSWSCQPSGTPGTKEITLTGEARLKTDGTFEGSDSSAGITSSIKGRFLAGKRIEITVGGTGYQANSTPGDACSASVTRSGKYVFVED